MTTTTVPITIACPDWCCIDPQEHADDLWNLGGVCDHRFAPVAVHDTEGYGEPLTEPRMHSDIDVQLVELRAPDGRPQASPMFIIDGCEHSIQQMTDLAATITRMVATYREESGR